MTSRPRAALALVGALALLGGCVEGRLRLPTYATCTIVVDNPTPFHVHRVYLDGQAAGAALPRSRGTVFTIRAGRTRLYAEADLVDRPLRAWGPRDLDCAPGSTYTWTLH